MAIPLPGNNQRIQTKFSDQSLYASFLEQFLFGPLKMLTKDYIWFRTLAILQFGSPAPSFN